MALWIASAVILLLGLLHVGEAKDYCDAKLCPYGGPHVNCDPPSMLGGPECRGMKKPRKIFMTHELKEQILDLHNMNRSNIALGKIRPYHPAVKMPRLIWDLELAELADANARSCHYGHDKCRATSKFPVAGQNIALTQFQGYNFKVKDLIHKFISSWWGEYLDAKPSQITHYPMFHTGKAIGHFTQIASDRTTKLGCSMWYWMDGDLEVYYFVCNYSVTNIRNKSVYKTGRAGSECKKGKDSRFPGLCNVGEEPRTIRDD